MTGAGRTADGHELWAGLRCPGLPLDAVWQLAPATGPVAVHDSVRGQPRILQACEAATRAGVRSGQRLTDALALLPVLQTRQRSPDGERRLLEQMALTAYAFSSRVVLAPPDSVLLEIGGSARLHGGIESLLTALKEQLDVMGLAACLGLAPLPAPARMLARLGWQVRSSAQLQRRLAGLSLAELDCPGEQLEALEGCGLRTVGDLVALPAAQRTRRFGAALQRYLDEIHGRVDVPLVGWHPPECFSQRLELPVATRATDALIFVINRGLDGLGQWLRARDRALTGLHITLASEHDPAAQAISVSLARPGFDPRRLIELVGLKLEPLRLAAPIIAASLEATSTAEHRPPQADLFSGHNRTDAWPALLDRLGARLGESGLAGVAAHDDHRPEKAWRWVRPGQTLPCHETRPRPNWLLPEPTPCRRESIRLEEGPERLETGWWEDQDCRRDYWVAHDEHGRRLWVFREYKPREGWFVHGIFG